MMRVAKRLALKVGFISDHVFLSDPSALEISSEYRLARCSIAISETDASLGPRKHSASLIHLLVSFLLPFVYSIISIAKILPGSGITGSMIRIRDVLFLVPGMLYIAIVSKKDLA